MSHRSMSSQLRVRKLTGGGQGCSTAAMGKEADEY